MAAVVRNPSGLAVALEQLGKCFSEQPNRQGILARRALGRPLAQDEVFASRLAQEMRRELRSDGSHGGAMLPTVWRAMELMDLGDVEGASLALDWVLRRQGAPGAYGEGCAESRHIAKVCEHFIGGFFSPAPPGERVAPITLPNGKAFRAEGAARMAVSCVALHAALRGGHQRRPLIEKHLASLVHLQEAWMQWDSYFPPDAMVSALFGLAASEVHRDAAGALVALIAGEQQANGSWPNGDLFHFLEALLATNLPDATEAVRRATPAVLARLRPNGTFGATARQERGLIGLRALLAAKG